MKIIINRCYDKSMSTKEIKDDFGFITFTREFTYLGSVISYDLDAFSDISVRIKKYNQAIGALNCFSDSEHVDTSAKVKIHLAIPINLFL